MAKQISAYTVDKQMILDYMQKHNLSKTAFCKLCGIGHSTLDNILKGNCRRIAFIRILQIAIVLKVRVQDLAFKQTNEFF